ncbi:MAG: ABC transporter permease, partial [Planctomycetales bacterium]
MLIGPVFSREWRTAPRRLRLYVARATYASGLLILITTAAILVFEQQKMRNVEETARFGALLFQFLSPLQLFLAAVFSALLSAGAVAQEKDRRTFVLLLMTRMTNSELVLGKLLSSILIVAVMLAAALPVFMLIALFGGVSFAQIGRVFGVTVAVAAAAGSLGSLVAIWREKTFQALAMTLMLLMCWLRGGEASR